MTTYIWPSEIGFYLIEGLGLESFSVEDSKDESDQPV